MIVIQGVITRITYYNEEQGFGIVRIKLDYRKKDVAQYRTTLFSNILTVLSSFDRKPIPDEEYQFTGELETSAYGIQLRAKSFKRVNEQSQEGVITYLSSDYFPGVGKMAASRIFLHLGPNAIQKIVENRSVLDDIAITQQQKDTIYENLIINAANEKQMVALLNLGITVSMANKIIKVLGDKAYEMIQKDPYQLIHLIERIGFLRADAIALSMGIAKDSPIRLKALVLYVLHQSIFSTGNTFIGTQDLYVAAHQLLKDEDHILDKDQYRYVLEELISDKHIVVDESALVYDVMTYYAEYRIAKRIYHFLQNSAAEFEPNLVEKTVENVAKNNHITYGVKQKEAIIKAIFEPIVIITGGPGTGKSTIIKGIIDTYSALFEKGDLIKEHIALVAPTGRASKRLKEVTKHEAMTIHKLLGFKGGHFTVTEEAPLDFKMIIIDEFSMVDTHLASILFSSITPTTKVIIVGDADQLPSIGPGNLLSDLINTKEITTIKLDKIHRQASDSSIIRLAHIIKEGQMVEDIQTIQPDRRFLVCEDIHMISTLEEVIRNALLQGYDLIRDIQVLVPIYKGDVGINAINHRLQDVFNPTLDEIIYQGNRFRVNDKVIQLVNRHDKQVMNGDIGYVLTIEKDVDRFVGMHVMFDFGSVYYEKDELDDLHLAYAISIHKAQGSEFGLVIVLFSFKYFMMLKRKLIYTAITRAKKMLFMIGNPDAMRRGVVELEETRQTKIGERIQEIFLDPQKTEEVTPIFESEVDDPEDISPYDFM